MPKNVDPGSLAAACAKAYWVCSREKMRIWATGTGIESELNMVAIPVTCSNEESQRRHGQEDCYCSCTLNAQVVQVHVAKAIATSEETRFELVQYILIDQ